MKFNHKINRLKFWCIQNNKIDEYDIEYTNALENKLSTYLDREFPSKKVFEKLINFIGITQFAYLKDSCKRFHTNPKIFETIDRLTTEFSQHAKTVIDDDEFHPEEEMPYYRIITDEVELSSIVDNFKIHWGYSISQKILPEHLINEMFFIDFDYFKPHIPQVEKLLNLQSQHVYILEPSVFTDIPFCTERDTLTDRIDYDCAFSPKDFSWLIYYSSSYFIGFAGPIVHQIKELLKDEIEHWNPLQSQD